MGASLSLWRHAVANYVFGRAYCASFELTHNCNARCKHCHRGEQIQEQVATPERLLEICKQVRPIVAIMSGGEPLMRAELLDIVRLFKTERAVPRVFVNTNAALLTSAKFAELCQAGVDELLISFDYPDDRHDEFRAIPGLFGRIDKLMSELATEDRKRIVLTSVLHSANFKDAPAMASKAKQWGVNINYSAYTWLRTNDRTLMVPAEQMAEFRGVVAELIQIKRTQHHVLTSEWVLEGMARFYESGGSIPGCRAGERSLVVNPDGTFSPCGLLVKDYPTREAMLRDFTENNTCDACYTSTRGNSERPAKYLFRDHLRYLKWRSNGQP